MMYGAESGGRGMICGIAGWAQGFWRNGDEMGVVRWTLKEVNFELIKTSTIANGTRMERIGREWWRLDRVPFRSMEICGKMVLRKGRKSCLKMDQSGCAWSLSLGRFVIREVFGESELKV